MKRINRGDFPSKYAFDWRDEPLMRVAQGEAFQLETDDALSGLIVDDTDDPPVHTFTGEHVKKLQVQWPPLYNPVVGHVISRSGDAGQRRYIYKPSTRKELL